MPSTLTWVDFSSKDREAMREVLKLFNEPGTVDDLGLGTLRDRFSDALFPGVSTIHTRLRYALFIPYVFLQMEASAPHPDAVSAARAKELALIEPLQRGLAGEDPGLAEEGQDRSGIIGGEAGERLSRLPSEVYWGALSRWGIFRAELSIARYLARLSGKPERRSMREILRADDPGIAVHEQEGAWHRRLGKLYDEALREGFPDAPMTFALTAGEANFLVDRWRDRCRGSLLLALSEGQTSTFGEASLWEHPLVEGLSPELRHTVALAKQFSTYAHGLQLAYNLLLAERYAEVAVPDRDERTPEYYRKRWEAWVEEWSAADDRWRGTHPRPFLEDLAGAVEGLGAPMEERTRRFLTGWDARLAARGPADVIDDAPARRLVEARERDKKKNRSRFENRERLSQWGGDSGTTRMVFRWPEARAHLDDVYRALREVA